MGDEVTIIGAGVIGCAIGWELARRGVKPTVIDGNGAVGHGSTAASCGIVRRFYSTPTMTAMGRWMRTTPLTPPPGTPTPMPTASAMPQRHHSALVFARRKAV